MIPVSQDIARVKLTVNPTTVAFDRYGGEATVTVTSSEQPTVSTSTAWCGVQAGSIGSNRETTVTIAAAAKKLASGHRFFLRKNFSGRLCLARHAAVIFCICLCDQLDHCIRHFIFSPKIRLLSAQRSMRGMASTLSRFFQSHDAYMTISC